MVMVAQLVVHSAWHDGAGGGEGGAGGGGEGGGGDGGGGEGGGGDGAAISSTCDATVVLGSLTMKIELANQLLRMVAAVVAAMVEAADDESAGVGKIMRTSAVTLDDW